MTSGILAVDFIVYAVVLGYNALFVENGLIMAILITLCSLFSVSSTSTSLFTYMSGCCPWNCFGICRRRRVTPSSGPPGGDDPIELQYPGSSPSANPNDYQYGEREMWGHLRQRWIDDATEPNCTVQLPNFEFRNLTHAKHRSQRWTTNFNRWIEGPHFLSYDLAACGLPVGEQSYHDVKITKDSVIPHPKRGMGTNLYQITTAMGVIVLRNAYRHDGPWWSQIALAQYDIHFARNILRHIYLENVVNDDTVDCVRTIWADTQPPNSGLFDTSPAASDQVSWNFDTPGYKAILGTELGKGAAAIVLSAYPRGTHRITKVVVWRQSILQVRFDIENKSYM
ncbi:hypothetical protein N7516_003550 [Penicillium verrucosum]|uniref:uncharacterized protein n=1 Tax=Penicillium verrucosum TaxID=60171 RepID=UPI002545753E|nr:uncharacterized protein N7516_003550 [Penicillium verrucosum]KAJ5943382.1 hypothetical protein N7516_003550 [Penicillium verrucosum]